MSTAERLREGVKSFGLARWIIVGFLIAIWILAAVGKSLGWVNLGLSTLLGDCLVRSGMNGLLVLALVLPVRAGNGLNFGMPLGIVCGLLAGIIGMEFAAPHPFGIESLGPIDALARGWSGFIFALALAIPFSVLAGWGYGLLLERVRGQEMMVGVYVGFGAVAGMCVLWLLGPFTSPELVWAIGGEGLRNTIVLNDYYTWILDSFGEVQFGSFEEAEMVDGERPKFQRPEGFYFPTGLIVVWLSCCGLLALFLRTRLGVAMTAAGENPTFARSIGIPVEKMRISATIASTVLAAVGILVFSQSYGFYQLYKAPLYMAFAMVASLLLGGASLNRATVTQAIIGTLLFQSLLTTSLPVVNDLVQNSAYKDGLANLPEIARLVIQNGVILYALSRVAGGRK